MLKNISFEMRALRAAKPDLSSIKPIEGRGRPRYRWSDLERETIGVQRFSAAYNQIFMRAFVDIHDLTCGSEPDTVEHSVAVYCQALFRARTGRRAAPATDLIKNALVKSDTRPDPAETAFIEMARAAAFNQNQIEQDFRDFCEFLESHE